MDAYPPELEQCRRCPRLAEHREAVAETKRRAYQDEEYWGKPVPGFGDPDARIFLLGLAPGAHGSNRTGRMFTGDASGDFLFPALYRADLSNQPESEHRGDGLELYDVWISAAARCVPPGNRPTRQEVANCRGWLEHDLSQLPNLKLVLALGQIAHDSYLELLKSRGHRIVKNRYPFAHGSLHTFEDLDGALPLLDAYHVSFQNTNTGKLTPDMFDDVLKRAVSLANSKPD
ncbi:MAG: uracil-DNA glycosylase [Trueperaceae bacterium]|nr:uracil-DNA glycosylase [Trueperaceae bacterium]